MYVGRFAPSPTGPLHFGSLIAAVGSYLEARSHHGRWLVRMEDIDPPREQPGAADQILKTLELFGFEWDEPVMYQSRRLEAYHSTLEQLSAEGKTYPCICSRKQIDASGSMVYPGTCRNRQIAVDNIPSSTRLRVNNKTIRFTDALQGEYHQHMPSDVGDFNLLRRDGLYSYHLAVTVDDAAQHISHIVRGVDLIESTPRQIYLQQQAGFDTPAYMHLPIATNAQGQKLSKQNLAAPIDSTHLSTLLWQALDKLGQQPPQALNKAPAQHIWEWAIHHWSFKNTPKQAAFVHDEYINNNEPDKT